MILFSQAIDDLLLPAVQPNRMHGGQELHAGGHGSRLAAGCQARVDFALPAQSATCETRLVYRQSGLGTIRRAESWGRTKQYAHMFFPRRRAETLETKKRTCYDKSLSE